MHTLIIHNVDCAIIEALKTRAATRNTSIEIEVIRALNEDLLKPDKKTFAEALTCIPPVGVDSDFERIQFSSSRRDNTNSKIMP